MGDPIISIQYTRDKNKIIPSKTTTTNSPNHSSTRLFGDVKTIHVVLAETSQLKQTFS